MVWIDLSHCKSGGSSILRKLQDTDFLRTGLIFRMFPPAVVSKVEVLILAVFVPI